MTETSAGADYYQPISLVYDGYILLYCLVLDIISAYLAIPSVPACRLVSGFYSTLIINNVEFEYVCFYI